MNTLDNTQYAEAATAALAECKNDSDLMEWDDRWTNNERYIHLPDALVKKLEGAYDTRIRELDAEAK